MRAVGSTLALLLALGLWSGAAAAGQIEIREDTTVVLKDDPERLAGKLISQDARELRIQLKDSRVIRTVPMSNVERILRKQDIAEAFKAALEADKARRDGAALHALAVEVLELNPGRTDEAVAALEAAREFRPDLGPARLMLGRLYLQKGPAWLAKAGEEAESAAKLLPDSAAALVLRAAVRGRLGKFAEARADLAKVLDGQRKLALDDRVAAAEALAEIGALAEAEQTIREALAAAPDNPAANLAAGRIYLAGANLVQAEKPLFNDKALGPLKDQFELHQARAALLYLKGDLAYAGREINEALNYGGARDARVQALRGLIAMRNGDPDGAAKAIDRALGLDPNDWRAVAAKATLELTRNNLDAALKAFDGPAADPPCTDAYVLGLKGYILYRKGDYAAALAACSRAAELAPKWLDLQLAAGSAALAGRNFSAARGRFQAAVELDADSATAHAGLGLACLGLPEKEAEAEKELRRAAALSADCVQAQLGLGFLHNRRRGEAEAIAAFERAIGLDGANAYAADALNKLRAGRGEEVQYFAFEGPNALGGWAAEERCGISIKAVDGRALFAGKQSVTNFRDTRLYIRMEAPRFARLDADLECAPSGNLTAGLFLAGERGFLELAMIENGKLAWRAKTSGGERPFEVVGEWPKGDAGAAGKLRLGLECVDPDRGAFRVYASGRPLTEKEIIVDTMARSGNFQAGAFCRAPLGEDVRIGLDNACLVTRKPKADEK